VSVVKKNEKKTLFNSPFPPDSFSVEKAVYAFAGEFLFKRETFTISSTGRVTDSKE